MPRPQLEANRRAGRLTVITVTMPSQWRGNLPDYGSKDNLNPFVTRP
jgi:hypothetical protein